MVERRELLQEAAKDAMTSATSGVGQATYGGADDEDDEEKGEDYDSCVEQVMADGHTEEEAHAICTDSVGKDAVEKYRTYLDADTRAEAEAEAPDDANVQEGEQGGFYYETDPDSGAAVQGVGDDEMIDPDDLDYEVTNNFEASVAEAVTEGWFGNTHHEDQYVAVRTIQQNAKKFDNPELLADALAQEREGRNSHSMVDALEKRMRALGVEPPGESEVDDGNPREGTSLEGFDSDAVVTAAVHTAWHWDKDEMDRDEWNTLFDHMTQDELFEAWSTALTNSHNVGLGEQYSMMDFEDGWPGDPYYEDPDSTHKPLGAKSQGMFLSRMDRDTLDQAREHAEEELDDDDIGRFVRGAVFWADDADYRRELIEDYDEYRNRKPAVIQFEEQFHKWEQDFKSEWNFQSGGFDIVQAHLADEFKNEGNEVTVYPRGGEPIAPVEPTEEMVENMETLRDKTARDLDELSARDMFNDMDQTGRHKMENRFGDADSAIENIKNDDGTITVYRGVRQEVSTHGTLESWSLSRAKANEFDGHAVMEAHVEPEDVLASKFGDSTGEYGFGDEEELVVMGGAFQ